MSERNSLVIGQQLWHFAVEMKHAVSIRRLSFVVVLALLAGSVFPSPAYATVCLPKTASFFSAPYLNPNTGRFWTRDDPEYGDQEDPQSLHLYNFCESDPVNNSDPSGHDIGEMLTVMDMGGIIFAAVSPGASKAIAVVALPLTARPASQTVRQLVAAIYAESSSKEYSGAENAVEKLAIGATIVNQAFYAKLPPGSKPKQRNYNKSFGDGTVLGAIKKSIVAYKKRAWNQVANSTDLNPNATISKTLIGSAREHYNLSVDAANAVTAAPMGIKDFNNEAPIGFNQAKDTAPNPDREHRIGAAGVHTFYGFDKGHEYQ